MTAVLLSFACGDDDGGESTRTPFIAPVTLSPTDAVAELDTIISLIQNPDQELVDSAGIGEFELQTRIDRAIAGTPQVPGLTEVRQLLEDDTRILAREYLHNNLVETVALPFTDTDGVTISADSMRTLDPLEAFAPDGEDLEVSGIFRDVAIRVIQLWYQI